MTSPTADRPAAQVTSPQERWLRGFRPATASASVRLVCLPHAGGWASFFRTWTDLLPDTYDHRVVQYPGRESRMADAYVTELHELADQVTEALLPLRDLPLVLFGHSMGASLAYEVARRLQERGHPPHHLVVSGHGAPSTRRPGTVHTLDDAAFLERIRELGGIDDAVLRHPELLELVLGPLRNDYRLIETYRPRELPVLSCPITAVRGDRETGHTPDQARAWGELTAGDFALLTQPGGHFYLKDRAAELIAELLPRLALPTDLETSDDTRA
ncbi:thioesterase [Streptomyces sp. ISL-36]|uniref:thioesterase II family protein n=1 Tax=Streptomyces sp. ISL-36 TaxID=2819182 RepID=UPI001BE91A86|nr:alpha/beta fold hydrolase [Streptomyces sp. ISL-36]MBT2440926.1 thioesterase [Streptomyces sp. ISL-36]